MEDLISAREAARLLHPLLGRHAVQRMLAAGLAGDPVVTAGATLYRRQGVLELPRREVVMPSDPLPADCEEGVLVVRWNNGFVGRAPVDPDAVAAGPWRFSPTTAAVLSMIMRDRGRLPLLVTVCHVVVGGADVLELARAGEATRSRWTDPLWRLRLGAPGGWYASFEDRFVDTGRGGNPWRLWSCPLLDRTVQRRSTLSARAG